MRQLYKPAQNKFVPKNTKPKAKKIKAQNDEPRETTFGEEKMIKLYHQLDHVYLKPNTVINIILRIRQPEK